ncbi:hypothetical protein BDV93DRAFT_559569 [Ceratobasidium sp. AG-I]|nr:hypothetical protein BDV93DRAFT_559569 [Ceratobasidium sp. AG-I]
MGRRERRRQTTRSNPMPVAGGSSAEGTPDTSLSVEAQPGIMITAPTPPAPRRSATAPLDGSLGRASGAEVPRAEGSESARVTVSRGTSVQFAPESSEGPRRARLRREASSGIASTLGVSEGSVHGKGKRKVEKEGPDGKSLCALAETGLSSPLKKQRRLSEEEMDITFMGEPLFGGVPQRSRSGHGSLDASSYYSGRSFPHTNPRHSYPNQHSNSPNPYPSPVASPEPERSTIPMRAIVTPRVQSLHGHGSDYASRRQSIGSIQRPKSRASARSNVTGGRSNGTGARSMTSSARGKRSWKDRLPLQGWCFILGFFMPFIWWYAAFSRAERGYYGGGVWSRDLETQWEGVKTANRDNGRIDAHTWRFRCRLMAAFSLVIYVPVIVLAAVFAR